MLYPKMGTLFKLQISEVASKRGRTRKWVSATPELLPDTAGLHYVDAANVVVTEKLDGANMWIDFDLGIVGKRSGEAVRTDKGDARYVETGGEIIRRADAAASALRSFGFPELRVFGELVGPGINSSGQLLEQREFVVFDVLACASSTRPHFFRWDAVKAIADALGLRHAPEVEGFPINDQAPRFDFDAVQEFVLNFNSTLNPDVPAEGVVVRDAQDALASRRRVAKIRRQDFPAPPTPTPATPPPPVVAVVSAA